MNACKEPQLVAGSMRYAPCLCARGSAAIRLPSPVRLLLPLAILQSLYFPSISGCYWAPVSTFCVSYSSANARVIDFVFGCVKSFRQHPPFLISRTFPF